LHEGVIVAFCVFRSGTRTGIITVADAWENRFRAPDVPPIAMSSPVPADATSPRPLPAGADAAPLSVQKRLGLLVILLILPVIAVSLPAIFVTLVFGQRPHPASPAPAAAAPDVSGLRNALERNAQGVLPPPAALASDPIVLTVRAEHVAARAAHVTALARQYGGSVSAGLPQNGETDLYADVPQAASAAFRQALTAPAATAGASPTAAAAPAQGAATMDHLEIIIRPAADDE
jgi:hypothetical protein